MVCLETGVTSGQLKAACLLMDGAVFPSCLLYGLRCLHLSTGACKLLDSADLGSKMATSGRTHTDQYSLCPCSHSEPQPTAKSPGELLRPTVSLAQDPMIPGPSAHETLCVPSRMEFVFPQSCGAPALKSHWPSKLNALGAPLPNARSPGWRA